MKYSKVFSLLGGLLLSAISEASQVAYLVSDFGAKGDRVTLFTTAIQGAVDKCARAGGGSVVFPPGRWVTGPISLADHVTVELSSGCTILGSSKEEHYGPPRQLLGAEGEQFNTWAIFHGKGLQSIAIRGRGTIDGQGSYFKFNDGRSRPKVFLFEECQDVLIEGVRLRNAGSWMQHYRDCERLTIRDVSVFNHVSYNNDGLNIDGCRDVTITGCMIDSDDDGIVLKSLSTKPTENVTISHCIVSSHCNAIKMGTESGGGFRIIVISNCTICSPRYSKVIYGKQRGLAGVALEIVDGGTLDGIAISNLSIQGVTAPLFMRLGDRGRNYGNGDRKPAVGNFRNVVINNIVADGCSSLGCAIAGIPGHPIKNVSLQNISLGFDGGGTSDDTVREIPEQTGNYPECTMFGRLPAYGIYCRHATGIKLQNITLRLATPDLRPAIFFDDVTKSAIVSLDADGDEQAAAKVVLQDSQDISVRDCCPENEIASFVSLRGMSTADVP